MYSRPSRARPRATAGPLLQVPTAKPRATAGPLLQVPMAGSPHSDLCRRLKMHEMWPNWSETAGCLMPCSLRKQTVKGKVLLERLRKSIKVLLAATPASAVVLRSGQSGHRQSTCLLPRLVKKQTGKEKGHRRHQGSLPRCHTNPIRLLQIHHPTTPHMRHSMVSSSSEEC